MSEWHKGWVILVKNPTGKWETAGPYSDDELKQKLASCEIDLKTWVWQKGLPKWTALGTLDVASQGSDWSYVPRLRPVFAEVEQLGWTDRLSDRDDDLPDDAIGEDLLKIRG